MKPTQVEILRQAAEHFGLPIGEVAQILKVPTHPAGMRDEFAAFAMQAHAGLPPRDAAANAYRYADAMLAERIKTK